MTATLITSLWSCSLPFSPLSILPMFLLRFLHILERPHHLCLLTRVISISNAAMLLKTPSGCGLNTFSFLHTPSLDVRLTPKTFFHSHLVSYDV